MISHPTENTLCIHPHGTARDVITEFPIFSLGVFEKSLHTLIECFECFHVGKKSRCVILDNPLPFFIVKSLFAEDNVFAS